MASEARHLHPQAEPLLDARLFPVDFGTLTSKVERLARKLAETAIERDKRGGHARSERELIRDSGLLSVTTARARPGRRSTASSGTWPRRTVRWPTCSPSTTCR
jgi:hypothetical protein